MEATENMTGPTSDTKTLLPTHVSVSKVPRPKSKSLQPCMCRHEGCGKIFSKRSNLTAHMRVHSGVLPYPCIFPGCTKRFRWKSSLKPHVKVHLDYGNDRGSHHFSPTTAVSPPRREPSPMARLTEAASRDSNRRTQLPRPTPSHVKLPLDIRSLTLPQGCVLETPKTGYSSPAAIINPSIFTSPAKSLGMTDGARYSCTHGSYGGRFIRLQELLGHEYTAIHADNTPSVERVLFQESKNEIESVETEGNDIRYNSVLSSWAGSYTTDEVRFALDSLAEDGPDHLSITNMAEDLWKDDLPVMDPFAVPFVNLPDSYKEKGIHSGLESGHGVFAACVDSMTLMDSHCMHPSSAFTASSAEFPH